MAAIGMVALGAFTALNKGAQASKLKYQDAQYLREASHRRMASTTADVAEQQRKKELIHSRAMAVAAASGGGVDDPGMVSLIGDLNAESEYNVLATLYTGSQEALGLTHQSEQAMREGDAAVQSSYLSAVTTVLSGAIKNDWLKGPPGLPGDIDPDKAIDSIAFNPNSAAAMYA